MPGLVVWVWGAVAGGTDWSREGASVRAIEVGGCEVKVGLTRLMRDEPGSLFKRLRVVASFTPGEGAACAGALPAASAVVAGVFGFADAVKGPNTPPKLLWSRIVGPSEACPAGAVGVRFTQAVSVPMSADRWWSGAACRGADAGPFGPAEMTWRVDVQPVSGVSAEGMVRVEVTSGSWRVTGGGAAGGLTVEYETHSEPGGSVGAWTDGLLRFFGAWEAAENNVINAVVLAPRA